MFLKVKAENRKCIIYEYKCKIWSKIWKYITYIFVKVGNGKGIILSSGATFYLSASVLEPQSKGTNQQIAKQQQQQQ